MALNRANIVWTAKQIAGMSKRGRLDFGHIVQRGEVWEKTRKSKLIESMMIGYPIPNIYARKHINSEARGDNTYVIMDGKQRLTAIIEYLNDEYELTGIGEVTIDDMSDEPFEYDPNGKKFSELPESLQDVIKDYTVSVMYFDELTFGEEKELFKRLNNGKPLSSKNKMLAECNELERIVDFAKDNELINEMESDKARENKAYVALVMKSWCMLYGEISELSFKSKTFTPIVESAEIADEEYAHIADVFQFMHDVHTMLTDDNEKGVARKLYTETHFVSLLPFAEKYMNKYEDHDECVEKFEEFVIDFFADAPTEYLEAASNAVASNDSINKRNSALAAFLDTYSGAEDAETVENTEEAESAENEGTECMAS